MAKLDYRLELRDRNMNFIGILDGRVQSVRWSYGSDGGCEGFSFRVAKKYCTELELGNNFNVRFYIRNNATKNYDIKYQGRIENRKNTLKGATEGIALSCYGYQSQLKDVHVNDTFTSTEISAIVTDLLDTYVTPNTDITYDAGDIDVTTFTPNSVKFNYVSLSEAFRKLSDITGGVVWGVDKNRKFFFKAKSEVTSHRYFLGGKILEFDVDDSSREIVNKVIVMGGKVSGSPFVYTKTYAKGELKYKLREKIVKNSAIVTDAVAEQFADAYYALNKGVARRGHVKIKDDVFFDDTVPMPRIEIITREIAWDEKNWDEFLWAGQEAFDIDKVSYTLSDEGVLLADLTLGRPVPRLVDQLKQLEYNLEQQSQSSF